MILEQRHSQSQKSCKSAQIFVSAIENRRDERTRAAHRSLEAHNSAALGTRVGGAMPASVPHRVQVLASLCTRVGAEVNFL